MGLWDSFTEAAGRQAEQKARIHEAKAGKTFRRTKKHLKKAAKMQRAADRNLGRR
jgi:hypothetical protein